MSNSLYVVILAGGKGERFWPLSTPEYPKPFLKFFSEKSLLQQTFDRARKLAPAERILLVVGKQHEKISRDQLPELPAGRLLLEPTGRDTAAAIGYASLRLPSDATMLLLPADHLIPDDEAFADCVRIAAAFVEKHGGPCTFGIRPQRPETGYGYIQVGEVEIAPGILPVKRFVEKPDRETAEDYVRQGSYYWNSGIFLWKVSRIRELIRTHLPQLWAGLESLETGGESFEKGYSDLQRISIDYGVMQKADPVVLVPATFRWDDIGAWTALPRILPTDTDGNLVWGSHVSLETSDCILYAESLKMVTAGIRDLIVVQRGDHILICHKSHADRLKELLAKLPK
jgi:mannose-1-phosphate guanylyltransferase